jgi:esterase/lipase superfamily enzyme
VKDPDSFGGGFNPESLDSLRFGAAELRFENDAITIDAVHVAAERLKTDPRKSVLGSRAVFEELKRTMSDGVDTLVFVHGYNVNFENALRVGGQLLRIHGKTRPINVVVFSWPSDGKMTPLLAYKRDRTDAAASGAAFARGLLKLQDFLHEVRRGNECGASIHLMAHSMGNYVLRHGIQEARRHAGGGLQKIFQNIFLMAADEDHDAFEHDHKLAPLPELGSAVNVYFNRGDTALVISDRTKSNPTRLGSEGPRLPLNVPGNVTLIDVSEVVRGLVEHSYFWQNENTVADVKAVLAGEPQDKIAKRRYVPSQNRYVLM